MSDNYTIAVTQPDLEKLVEETMNDELSIAKGKWKIFLTDEEDKLVLEKSKEQVLEKAKVITKDLDWTFSDTIHITPVRGKEGGFLTSNICLPADRRKHSLNLIEVNDGWKIEKDHSIESIPIFDFSEKIVSDILTWSRTAVFYGVGSFKER